MELVFDIFHERKREIEAYLDFIKHHEKSFDSSKILSTPEQYQILLACVYILIYNMIEATIVKLIENLEQELYDNQVCPRLLTPELKREWAKNELGTSDSLNPETRLKKAMQFLDCIYGQKPFKIVISKDGGGNWHDEKIYKLSERLGIDLSKIPQNVITDVKHIIRDDMGCVQLVVHLRNKLAHGGISFCECGKDKDLNDVKEIFNKTCAYIEGIITSFKQFIEEKKYIIKSEEPFVQRAPL